MENFGKYFLATGANCIGPGRQIGREMSELEGDGGWGDDAVKMCNVTNAAFVPVHSIFEVGDEVLYLVCL